MRQEPLIDELTIKASKLGREILFLRRDLAVPFKCIADAFRITEGNAKVIVHRETKHPLRIPELRTSSAWLEENEERVAFDRDMNAEELAATAAAIARRAEASSDFDTAASNLQALLPYIGRIKNPVRRRTFARIHHHIAWCYQHRGYTASAIRHSDFAAERFRELYSETGEPRDMRYLAEAALVSALALRMFDNIPESWRRLGWADKAYRAQTTTPGSEFHRQRGVLLLDGGHNERAKNELALAAEQMLRKNEARTELQLKFQIYRYAYISDHEVEDAFELRDEIRSQYQDNALHAVMALNFAVASAIAAGSEKLIQLGLDDIDREAATLLRFAHQQTVAQLLTLTDRLKLEPPQRQRWALRVLRANAFRKY